MIKLLHSNFPSVPKCEVHQHCFVQMSNLDWPVHFCGLDTLMKPENSYDCEKIQTGVFVGLRIVKSKGTKFMSLQ